MDISVVILTWNSQQHIERCLSSLVDSLGKSSFLFEIIIVDNGSIDDTKTILEDFVAKYSQCISLVFLEKNTGTTFSRNIALRRATGEFICVLDSDVEVSFGIFELLVSNLKTDISIGLIVPKLVYPNGSLQKSTDQFPTLLSKVRRFFFLKQIEKADEVLVQSGVTREVDYAISAFWLFPQRIINEVGYLDENIFYAPEDVDYCLRIWKQNNRIVYEPSVSAVHYAQEISRSLKLNKAFREHVKGLVYYFAKHRYLFVKPFFRIVKGPMP